MRSISEWQIIRGYVRLLHAHGDERGCRHFALARHGAYEVRLCELSHDDALWLELFDHDERRTLHSCDCRDFGQAVSAADELVWLARELDQRPGPD